MLKPLHDYVLIKPFARQDSNIIHVVTNKRMVKGQVVAVGNGRYDRPTDMQRRQLDVMVGDIVSVGETPLKFPTYEENGNRYWIIQESDIAFVEQINQI